MTAIEFGLLALPFFTIIYAIIETAVVFLAGQILDSAVQDAARLIRTGQAQSVPFSLDTFRASICNNLYDMFDCDQVKLKVDVVANFASSAPENPVEDGADCENGVCEWTIDEGYEDGIGSDVILVEAYYKWPVVVKLPGFNLQNMGDGTRLLAAVRVFRNEPF